MADRLLRERQVLDLIPWSRSTLWRQEREGKFPRRRKASKNTAVWLESEVVAFISSLSAEANLRARNESLPASPHQKRKLWRD